MLLNRHKFTLAYAHLEYAFPAIISNIHLTCAGAVVGSACGIASWLAYAKIGYGEITVDTTGFNMPLLTGNVVSLGLSLLITVVGSLVFPDKTPFNWEELNKKITKTEDTVRFFWPADFLFSFVCPFDSPPAVL